MKEFTKKMIVGLMIIMLLVVGLIMAFPLEVSADSPNIEFKAGIKGYIRIQPGGDCWRMAGKVCYLID